MKFIIKKSSEWDDSEQPHMDAVKMDVIKQDRRTFKTLKETRESQVGFFDRGTNHREEDGGVVRDLAWQAWVVEVEDLLEFIKATKEDVIVSVADCLDAEHNEMMKLEIYDDYRE